MTRRRGFEIVSKYQGQGLHLPQRSTNGSAGYDLRARARYVIPVFHEGMQPVQVYTGIKAYFPSNEVLYIFNRSSNPLKRGLYLANGVGVDDADYYNNPANEGELVLSFVNLGTHDYVIHKNDRVAQCVFMPYLKADHDAPRQAKRTGGFGSTGK